MVDRKEVIVVLGSGHSGASLLMQLLEKSGMSVSENMVSGKEHNPEGTYEDLDIYKVQEDLLSGMTPMTIPPPEGWLDSKDAQNSINELIGIVADRVNTSDDIWGFKGPRTPYLIPAWTRIFNRLDLIPKYILSVRDPACVALSRRTQFRNSENLSELVWLAKYSESLYRTGMNCFILHYEDWFTDKREDVYSSLLDYAGIGQKVTPAEIANTLDEVVAPGLNRSVVGEYEVKNRNVESLYQALENCHGYNFDRPSLMEVVKECRHAMKEYSGWAGEAQRIWQENIKLGHNQLQLEKNSEGCERREYEQVRLQVDYDCLKTVLGELKSELREKTRKSDLLERNNLQIRISFSYQLGQIFTDAVVRPGKNTILLPYRALKLLLERVLVGPRV